MISVCMTTFNGDRFLQEQLSSILDQLDKNDELIISDDGSSDKTLEIIASYSDNRIKLLHHQKNVHKRVFSYTTDNMNNALSKVKGDYIFLADQDDVWLPDKIQKMIALLKDYDVVVADCRDVDSNLEILAPSHFHLIKAKEGFFGNLYKSCFLGSNMCFRRNVLCCFYPIPVSVPHDLWIGLISSLSYKIVLFKEVTMLYRRHDANVSSINNKLVSSQKKNAITLKKNTNSYVFKLGYRVCILLELFKFYCHRKYNAKILF